MPRLPVLAVAIVVSLGLAANARAQATTANATATQHPHDAASETQRNVNQQSRIEHGLQSGALTTHEAGKLERGQQVIDKTEQRAMRNGSLSPAERARIQKEQNVESRAIKNQKHDAQTGHPESKSSQRMQADVQRNLNQQQRIHNGVSNGSLTNHEVGNMEGRQAHSDHELAGAARNGRVGAREQSRIQRSDNRDSRRIYRKKHNRRNRG